MATINYKIIKNFFSKKELNVLQKYCYNRIDFNKDYQVEPQSFSPAWYNDPLMIALCCSYVTEKICFESFPKT